MESWQVILLIAVALIIVSTIYVRRKKTLAATASQSNGLGVQLRKGAEQIPVYGTFVKAAGVVGKPINNVLDRSVDLQIKALKHVPVVGNIAAKPLEWSKDGVKKLNNWLGL